jgi:thiamine-monophosphate kinase
MDLSDGLSLDLYRLTLASRVSAALDAVPIARGATLMEAFNRGEDYELLFTLPPSTKAPRGAIRIGVVTRGHIGRVTYNGEQVNPQGHDHFRTEPHS